MTLVEQCRQELASHGYPWTARDLDIALYELGGSQDDATGERHE